MTTIYTIKSLSMLKMEKNFIAAIDKNYPRRPYEEWDIVDLHSFVEREQKELKHEVITLGKVEEFGLDEYDQLIKIMNEVADVSNTLDYLYEALLQKIIFLENKDNGK